MRTMRRFGSAALAVGSVALLLTAGAAGFGRAKAVARVAPTKCTAIEQNFSNLEAAAARDKNPALESLVERQESAALAANHCG